jgi:hypothetical protein
MQIEGNGSPSEPKDMKSYGKGFEGLALPMQGLYPGL